jgi:type II secretory pathway component PulK
MSASKSKKRSRRGKRRDVKRRAMKKLSLLFLLVSGIALPASLFFFGMRLLGGGTVEQKRGRLLIASIYLAVSLGSALVALLLKWLRRRRADRVEDGTSPPFPPTAGRNGGSVLLIVLALLGGAAVLMLHLQASARSLSRLAQAEWTQGRLRAAAAEGVLLAAQRLADDENLLADSPREPWAEPLALSRPPDIEVRVHCRDAQAAYDLNNLALESPAGEARPPGAVLSDLLNLAGIADTARRVSAVRDWIDDDQEGPRESAFYAERTPPYACPDALMRGTEELPLLDGFDAEVLRADVGSDGLALADCIDALGDRRMLPVPVNVNAAPAAVLRAVLGPQHEGLVRLILARREAGELRSADVFLAALPPAEAQRILRYLDVKSRYFRIAAAAASPDGALRIRALARRDADGAVSILRWMPEAGS